MNANPWIRGAVLASLSFSSVASAAVLEAKHARLVEVTAYPDRAEVVREVTVDVPAGASVVEFKDIPLVAERDSFRVTAKGTPAQIGAVTIRQWADTPEDTPEQIALRNEVKRLEGELAKLGSQEKVANDLREFLKSLRSTTAQRESDNLGAGKADPQAIVAVYDLLAKKLGDLGDQELVRRDAAAKLGQDLEVAKAKLQTARAGKTIRSHVADAEILAKQAGPLTLRLSYLVTGASWSPAYRATLDAGSGEVALVSEAVVRQVTGEDWTSVALKLSTAAPARGVAPPEMTALLLRPAGGGFTTSVSGISDLPVAGRAYQNSLLFAPGEQRRDSEEDVAAAVEAEIVRSAYNVAFEVPGRSDVPADGADHRVVLRQEALPGTLTYRIAPALDSSAFLTSIVRAPEKYPLLSGSMRVLAGAAYLGMYEVPETAAGAELTLPFGRDNRIKVERVRQPQDRTLEGITGKTRQIAYEFKTSVENLRDRDVTIILEDRVPVSEDERIVVEMGKGTTGDHAPSKSRPGVVLWKLNLAPHQKKDVVLAYTVRYPKDMLVPGLE